MDKGHLVYEYNMMEIERYNGRSEEPLKPGKHRITVDTKIAKPAANTGLSMSEIKSDFNLLNSMA